MLQNNLSNMKRLYGVENDVTLFCMGQLVHLHMCQDLWNEAEKLSREEVECRNVFSRPNDVSTLISMRKRASILARQGRLTEAEEPARHVLDTQNRTVGWENVSTLNTGGALADILADLGRYEEAVELVLTVKAGLERLLGPEYPDTLVSMNNLSIYWKRQGRSVDAVNMMAGCVRLGKKVLGENHSFTLCSVDDLSRWQSEMLMYIFLGLVARSSKHIYDQCVMVNLSFFPSISYIFANKRAPTTLAMPVCYTNPCVGIR